MKRVCVFCGSSPGTGTEFIDSAKLLGESLVEREMTLVYGGGGVGLMGQIGRSVLNAGGTAIGIMPRALYNLEVALEELTDLRIVGSMHERKALMAELADGFIALPGGLGTIEEFFEALTWAQLDIHTKPCGLLNIAGYYDDLLAFLEHAVEKGFILEDHRKMILEDHEPDPLLDAMERYRYKRVDKAAWARRLNKPEN